MSSHTGDPQSSPQISDLKKQYQQAEYLRERIDEELDSLSKASINDDTQNLRTTVNSNITAMAFLASGMRESLEAIPVDSQQKWRKSSFFFLTTIHSPPSQPILVRIIEELEHVREEQKIQLDTIWLKLQAQAERTQRAQLLSTSPYVCFTFIYLFYSIILI